jgi:myo-inositol 2-dehydrogenase/D-chiro-inositol 1-dehydrogenase
LKAANKLEHLVEHAGAQGFTTAPNKHFFLERYEAAYIAEMEAFVAALKSGGPSNPSISDGVAAQRLADAAAKSLETGRPVKLG